MITEEPIVEQELICTHCGEKCEDASISVDNNYFCCLGCKTVFEILNDNGLDAYYRLEDNPGNSLKREKGNSYYSFLDTPAIWKNILDYNEESLAKVRLFIPSIHCSSCIWLLENLYQLKKGILVTIVDFPRKTMQIDFNPQQISFREVVEVLAALGYPPDLDLENNSEDKKDLKTKSQRELLVKIGVAGFAFGNIMLFSFPEYIGLDRLTEPEFSRVFSAISMLFSIPVVFYSAADYFKASWQGIKQKVMSIDIPIVIGIMALFLRSSYEVISFTGTGYFDSLAGLVFFLLVGKWFQGKTYESLLFDRNYKSYFPIAITRLKDDESENIPINELSKGDRIRVRNAELVPADCILMSNEARIDNSFVTGESTPVHKSSGDYVYAGGRQVGPAIELEVAKEVSQSYLTQLWNNDVFEKEDGGQGHILINRVSKYFTMIVFLLAVFAGVFWLINEPSVAINAFTAVLIVACPCALALSTPFATGSTMRVFGQNGFYLKNGEVIEKMAAINHIVFDKTGTITKQSDIGDIIFIGNLSSEDMILLEALTSNSSHPVSRMIGMYLNANAKVKEQHFRISDFEERKGMGISAFVNGNKIFLGSAKFTGASEPEEKKIDSTRAYVSINGIVNGFFKIGNKYRNHFEDIIDNISENYELSVLSGDNSSEKDYLELIFPSNSDLQFDQTAFDKLDYIKGKQKNNERVLMLGDGLNDAGALAQADVGIAIADDINNFTPASDAILSGSNFRDLPRMLKFSKTTMRIIIVSFILSFLYNIVGLSFAVSGMLTPVFAAILMPLSSITVVVFATGSVSLMAKRIGFK